MTVKLSIRWIRLKKICEELCGREVHIHSSTEMPDDHVAGCEFNDDVADIILNMKLTKSEDMVIKAIAHEMVHILNNNNKHNIMFDKEWLEMENTIRSKYMN